MDSVEGVWGDFTFKFIEPSDYPKVLEFLRNEFIQDELVCSLNPDTEGEDSFADFKQFYEWVFNSEKKLSFIALETATGDVAGVRATFDHRKDMDFEQIFSFKSKKIKALLKVVTLTDIAADPFGKMGLDHFAHYITASVGKRFTRRGLVSEMYKRSLAQLKERNFPFVKSTFTSPWTRKATANLNFTEYARIYFRDIKNEDGSLLLPNAKEEDFATFAGIYL